MNFKIGNHSFIGAQVPLLWGSRAVLQDKEGRLAVIDLSGPTAKPEIVGDKPAPGIEFLPTFDGFKILYNNKELYSYNPDEKTLMGQNLGLPSCTITPSEIRVGGGRFSGNVTIGSAVGLVVTEDGVAMGASMPPNLARLML